MTLCPYEAKLPGVKDWPRSRAHSLSHLWENSLERVPVSSRCELLLDSVQPPPIHGQWELMKKAAILYVVTRESPWEKD